MTLNEIFQIVGGVSFVGIVAGVIAKFIAERIINKDNQRFKKELQDEIALQNKELEEAKTALQKDFHNYARYSDTRFKHYTDLWRQLIDLKFEGENLWESLNQTNLESFKKCLKETMKAIEQNRLLLEDAEYISLKGLIKSIKNYDLGKTTLLQFNLNSQNSPEPIKTLLSAYIVSRNQKNKAEYEQILDRLAKSFKNRIESI